MYGGLCDDLLTVYCASFGISWGQDSWFLLGVRGLGLGAWGRHVGPEMRLAKGGETDMNASYLQLPGTSVMKKLQRLVVRSGVIF